MKAWKLFYINEEGQAQSLTAMGWARIVYPIGKRVSSLPPLASAGYFPVAFRTREDAQKFWDGGPIPGVTLEEVEVGEEIPLPQPLVLPLLGDGERLPSKHETWPEGTMMVRWVKRCKI